MKATFIFAINIDTGIQESLISSFILKIRRKKDMSGQLVELTNQLIHYNQEISAIYQEAREKKEQKPFYECVKPFAEKVAEANKMWRNLLKRWISENSPQHLHEHQVESVYEHIERLSIQAFYPETSRSRFLNAHRTVDYFLKEVLLVIQK